MWLVAATTACRCHCAYSCICDSMLFILTLSWFRVVCWSRCWFSLSQCTTAHSHHAQQSHLYWSSCDKSIESTKSTRNENTNNKATKESEQYVGIHRWQQLECPFKCAQRQTHHRAKVRDKTRDNHSTLFHAWKMWFNFAMFIFRDVCTNSAVISPSFFVRFFPYTRYVNEHMQTMFINSGRFAHLCNAVHRLHHLNPGQRQNNSPAKWDANRSK